MIDPVTRADFEQISRAVEAMTTTVAEGIAAQTEAVRDMARAMDTRSVESARATGGRVEMNVTAGSLAAWVAATCCAVAMTGVLCLGGAVLWLAIRSNDHGHQMNAVYQSVPGLRELVAEQMQINESAKSAENQQEPSK